jgi:hypothetical protein
VPCDLDRALDRRMVAIVHAVPLSTCAGRR